MADIITLSSGLVSKTYPNDHNNWQSNFDKLKEKFDWIIENDTILIQEPTMHEYFKEETIRTCIPRKLCSQYYENNFFASHRVHLLESKKSAILLSGGYWISKDEYPSWANENILILSKSVWIEEEGKEYDTRFNEFDEYYFKCSSEIAKSEFGFTTADDDDTTLFTALVKKDGTVIGYRMMEKNTEIEDNEDFLDRWDVIYITIARKQNKKQFAKDLIASGLV